MKFVIIACLVAVAVADKLPVAILSQNSEGAEDGSYKHNFESADGIKVEESGKVKQLTPEEDGITARGSYSYTAPDGTLIKVDWVADENGFQPTGAHLPVAPPTPDHVLKLLDTLRSLGAL